MILFRYLKPMSLKWKLKISMLSNVMSQIFCYNKNSTQLFSIHHLGPKITQAWTWSSCRQRSQWHPEPSIPFIRLQPGEKVFLCLKQKVNKEIFEIETTLKRRLWIGTWNLTSLQNFGTICHLHTSSTKRNQRTLLLTFGNLRSKCNNLTWIYRHFLYCFFIYEFLEDIFNSIHYKTALQRIKTNVKYFIGKFCMYGTGIFLFFVEVSITGKCRQK